MDSNKYIPELDGYRAIAVLMVMLHHSKWGLFSTGWIGVQFFFGLSGFLITRILLKQKHSPSYFKTFYTRRILRIFPAYFLVVFIGVVYGLVVGSNVSDVYWYLFYLQNFPLGAQQWSLNFPEALNHTWSLAIEEQFYLFAPLIVKFLPTRKAMFAFLGLCAASVFFKIGLFINQGATVLNYTHTFSNLDIISAGCWLACRYHLGEQKLLSGLLVKLTVGYLIFYAALALSMDQFLWPWQYPDLGSIYWLLFHVLLLLAVPLLLHLILIKRFAIVSRMLTSSPLVQFGQMSYGLYLYHYLVFRIVDLHFPIASAWGSFMAFLIKCILSWLVARWSWKYFEQPILKRKEVFQYTR